MDQQMILPLGGTLAAVVEYFSDEAGTLTAEELAAVCADAATLGKVPMSEYRRCIGAGNLKLYARCLVAQNKRNAAARAPQDVPREQLRAGRVVRE